MMNCSALRKHRMSTDHSYRVQLISQPSENWTEMHFSREQRNGLYCRIAQLTAAGPKSLLMHGNEWLNFSNKTVLAELSKGDVEQAVQLKLKHAWLVCFSELPKTEAVSSAMDERMYCWLAISRFTKIIQIGMTFAIHPSSQMHMLKKLLLTDIVWHETLAYML